MQIQKLNGFGKAGNRQPTFRTQAKGLSSDTLREQASLCWGTDLVETKVTETCYFKFIALIRKCVIYQSLCLVRYVIFEGLLHKTHIESISLTCMFPTGAVLHQWIPYRSNHVFSQAYFILLSFLKWQNAWAFLYVLFELVGFALC